MSQNLYLSGFSVAGPGLRKLYEIGNTKSRVRCQPRPQNGVEGKRMQFQRSYFRTGQDIPVPVYIEGQYNGPKRRAVVDFKCLVIGEQESDISTDNSGCKQVFDTIETANLACSLFEKCVLIGQNSDGNFELFAESDNDTAFDLEEYNLSIPTMDKTPTSLIYGNLDGFLNIIPYKLFYRFYDYSEPREYGHNSNNSF